MKYLVTGANGMLGQDIVKTLEGRDVRALGHAELDVTDPNAVRAAVAGRTIVINCAAYTNVDAAESNETLAHDINAGGAANLAAGAAASGAILVQISTDYVFDGTATSPYPEGFPLSPVSAYGRTKAEGERLAQALNPGRTFILRTAWLYGLHGSNFVRTILRLAQHQPELRVVTDQLGQPSWSGDVAEQLVAMLDANAPAGVYHATNSGQATWFEFANAIFSTAGWDTDRILPTTAAQFARPAPRPDYSVLGHSAWAAAGLPPMRDWREALAAAYDAGVFRLPEKD